MPRVEITVEGMTCDHCETSVTAALQTVGATAAQADFRRGRASAEFDGDPAVLVDAIRQAGYTPGPIETDATASPPILATPVDDYDLAIVGSGGAAFAAAIRAIEVDERALLASTYLVATGAEPRIPDLPGLVEAGYLTSATTMELTELPARVVTIGGGFVGMEQSQLLARLGAKVIVVGRLAPRAEPELAAWMGRVFADEGIGVVSQRAVGVEMEGAEKVVACADGTRLPADAILVAVGRSPRVDALDLDAAGVKLDEGGFVAVDEELRTSNPAIFAAGDVIGGPQYVYVAAAQGNLAADNTVGNAHRRVDYTGLPSVIFTDPALASAGMTEAEAKAAGHNVVSRVLQLENVPRALANRDTRGAIKLVAEASSGKVLGVHAVAEGAGDLILAGVYAIKFGLTVDDLANTWAPYLTMSEGLKLVAQSFKGDVKKLSCCAA